MPGGQRLVVDAKVSLTEFEALVNAGTEDDRSASLQRHLASVRNHIITLGSKEYHSVAGTTLDYVVMFVPIEGALAAALQAEPNLILFATERNVAITTPSTLMIALRTIANVWQVERRNQNAEEIAIRAGRLYEKFVGFIGDMEAIEDGIGKTKASFDRAMNKLKTGNGNVIRQVEQLKSMGGRTSKVLPAALLEAAETEATLELTSHTTEAEVTLETAARVEVTVPAVGGDGELLADRHRG
jgi:DNA recombination protein RmuC